MFDLNGHRALVTGASSGLGAGFARMLAGAGAELVLAARRMKPLETLADEIKRAGGKAVAVSMDVTSLESVTDAFARISESGRPADIVVNNSGISRESWIAKMDEAD